MMKAAKTINAENFIIEIPFKKALNANGKRLHPK